MEINNSDFVSNSNSVSNSVSNSENSMSDYKIMGINVINIGEVHDKESDGEFSFNILNMLKYGINLNLIVEKLPCEIEIPIEATYNNESNLALCDNLEQNLLNEIYENPDYIDSDKEKLELYIKNKKNA